jgi:prepilin-type N-terminal cleavage/methylation domain-containing protein
MLRNNRGLSLIELILVVVLIAIIAPSLLGIFYQVSWRALRAEAITQATFYAEQLMEEISSKRFDENTIAPWSSSLGPEAGESYPNYDDVDDFNGYLDSPASGYTRSVSVVYLDPNISPGGTWQILSLGTSDYKRVTVTISRSDGLVGNLSVATMVSGD